MSSSTVYIDISGSVGGDTTYWAEVDKIIKSNKFDNYYLWDDRAVKSNLKEVKEYIIAKRGCSGTCISSVARSIIADKHLNDRVYIITDGDVSSHEVDLSSQLLLSKNINYVECHIIKSSSYYTVSTINISVPLAFMRNNNAKLYFSTSQESQQLVKDIKKEDYELLNNNHV